MTWKSLIFTAVMTFGACAFATETPTPAAQQCVTNTDSVCTGEATIGVSIPLRSKSERKKAAAGECEMFFEGEKGFGPCRDIKLVARSVRENDVRTATFDGKTFRFEGLGPSTYNLEAISEKYEVSTDTKVLNPGQNVKIRVKVKPRP